MTNYILINTTPGREGVSVCSPHLDELVPHAFHNYDSFCIYKMIIREDRVSFFKVIDQDGGQKNG